MFLKTYFISIVLLALFSCSSEDQAGKAKESGDGDTESTQAPPVPAPNQAIAPIKIAFREVGKTHYKTGENVELLVTFSDTVIVSSKESLVPRLTLRMDDRVGYASYHSGSGTETLLFKYLVEASDDTEQIGIDRAIDLNSSEIRGFYGDEKVGLGLPTLKAVRGIDTVKPAMLRLLPLETPSTNPTPTITVSGVEEGATVRLYSDSSCSTPVSDNVKVPSGESEVSIKSHSLGDGSQDASVNFYANQTDVAGNESSCSARIGYVLDVTAPLAPTSLALEAPRTSRGNDPTPTLTVSGVEEGAIVTLYSDSSCANAISDSVKVPQWGNAVSVTSHSLGDGSQDEEVSFYATQIDRAGNISPCSSASVSYIADFIAPAPPSALSLSNPSTSPGNSPTPVILVEGIEEGASATLYSDSSCTSAISSAQTVAAGQSSVLITSHHLGNVDRSVDYYSAQVDFFGRASGCSMASASYQLISLPTLKVKVGYYSHNSPLRSTFKINAIFNENVIVTGTPRIGLTIGTTTKYATYLSGSGSTALLFSYDISSDDYDDDGIQIITKINLNGGTIKNNSNQNVRLRFEEPDNLMGVFINFEEKIYSNQVAFAFLKSGGSVVTWGDLRYGADSSSVSSALASGVSEIFSNYYAFAALKDNGSVVTWGRVSTGGSLGSITKYKSGEYREIGNVSDDLQDGVIEIFSNSGAFAALKDNGSVVTWGSTSTGGSLGSMTNYSFGEYLEIGNVSDDLQDGVIEIFSNTRAFAALKDNGSVVTWGYNGEGGNSSYVSNDLQDRVIEIFSNYYAFAALKDDGSVVTWGDLSYGADSSSVSGDLASGVSEIFSNYYAFAALKDDGSVVTWGESDWGGDSSSLSSALASGVSEIFSSTRSLRRPQRRWLRGDLGRS